VVAGVVRTANSLTAPVLGGVTWQAVTWAARSMVPASYYGVADGLRPGH